jgi:hypothetical protein
MKQNKWASFLQQPLTSPFGILMHRQFITTQEEEGD